MRDRRPPSRGVSSNLESVRRWLRPPAYDAQVALWWLLSAGQLGVSFRRQVPLGDRYIGDFVARSARLVVEVDGGWHRGRGAADARPPGSGCKTCSAKQRALRATGEDSVCRS